MQRQLKLSLWFWIPFGLIATGCSSGLQHLLAGLAVEEVLDPQPEDGLSCWDLNGDGVFDADEDMDGDGEATAYDCRGAQGEPGINGLNGIDGENGDDGIGVPGPPGAIGPAGPEAPPPPAPIEDDDGPPFGRGPKD